MSNTAFRARNNFRRAKVRNLVAARGEQPSAHPICFWRTPTTLASQNNFRAAGGPQPESCADWTTFGAHNNVLRTQQLWVHATTFGVRGLTTCRLRGEDTLQRKHHFWRTITTLAKRDSPPQSFRLVAQTSKSAAHRDKSRE